VNIQTKSVTRCPICSSEKLQKVTGLLADKVLKTNIYSTCAMECLSCSHAFLTTVLVGDSLTEAYKGYYTQSKSNQPGDRLFDFFMPSYRFLAGMQRTIKSMLHVSFFYPIFGYFLRRAIRFFPFRGSEKTVLDIGCGNGKFLKRCRTLGYQCFGIDVDPVCVDLVRSYGIKAESGDITEFLDNHDSSFDFISSSHVIEHVGSPVNDLSAMLGLLKPGGKVYLATPNFNALGRKIFSVNWRGYDFPRHLHFFTEESLLKSMKKAGFKDIKVMRDRAQSALTVLSSARLSRWPKPLAFLVAVCSFLYCLISPKNLDIIVVMASKT